MPSTYLASSTRTNRFLGRCEHCIRPIAVEDAGHFADILYVDCPDCTTHRIKLERVYGTIERMSCDSRCEGAIGNMCVCSCGGVNHGGAFLRTGEALATAIANYRATTQRRQAAAQLRAENRRRANAERLEAAHNAYLQTNAVALTRISNYSGENSFVCDIKRQHENGRELSERQISAVLRVMEQEAQTEIRRREEAANAVPQVQGS